MELQGWSATQQPATPAASYGNTSSNARTATAASATPAATCASPALLAARTSRPWCWRALHAAARRVGSPVCGEVLPILARSTRVPHCCGTLAFNRPRCDDRLRARRPNSVQRKRVILQPRRTTQYHSGMPRAHCARSFAMPAVLCRGGSFFRGPTKSKRSAKRRSHPLRTPSQPFCRNDLRLESILENVLYFWRSSGLGGVELARRACGPRRGSLRAGRSAQ
jgi:hypothetical protein